MEKYIQITAGSITLKAVLYENETANAIWESLPIEGHANRWGEEIYFTIPVQLNEADDARQEMDIGELGYWPTGSAFCIFFGPTPVSRGSQPRAYSSVNPFGKIDGDATILDNVKEGEKLSVVKDRP
jgi:hypothetical protein